MELQNVTKLYRRKTVLQDVNFSLGNSEVTAIVGKNGSGKSTLLKIMSGLIKPDRGQILFRNGAAIRIGYVPEIPPMSIPFSLVEYLRHMGAIRGLPKERLKKRIDVLLKMFHMDGEQNTRIAHFSKGMKQKVTIMQALLEEIDLLIMDEPLSGLDPRAQTELEDLLMYLKKSDISIVLTCHEARLLERIVDRMVVINQGQIRLADSSEKQAEPMNRLVFECTSTESIIPLGEMIVSKRKQAGSEIVLIELKVTPDKTNDVVRELLDQGATIKLLAPLHKKETEFLKQFKEGED